MSATATEGPSVRLEELQNWFGEDELEVCPRCARSAALTMEHAQAVLCFKCGLIRWPGGDTSVSELQGRPPVESRSGRQAPDRGEAMDTAVSGDIPRTLAQVSLARLE